MRKVYICIKILSIFLLSITMNSIFCVGKVVQANTVSEVSNNRNDIIDMYNYKAKSNRIEVNGIYYGNVSGKDPLNKIAKEIVNIYVGELGLDLDVISSVNINLLMKINEENIKVTEIDTLESVAKKIYNDRDNNSLNIELKTIQEFNETIESGTKYVKTEELYMGQSKAVEGSDGLKSIMKLITYNLNSSTEEIVLGEEVVQASTSNIVYEGERNPYLDGIAFLNKPISSMVISSEFGTRWNAYHKGIDIAANTGESVKAAINGNVIYAQYNDGGYGNLIIIEHDNNMKSYYAHLSKIEVNLNDKVQKGDHIGEVGSTGRSTGPHLHFELRVDNEPVDPLKYMIK